MIKHLVKYLFLFLPSFFVLDFFAQDSITAIATLSSNKIKMGDQVQLLLTFKCKDGAKVSHIQFPSILDSVAPHIELVSASNIDTFFPDKNNPKLVAKQQSLVITSFDSGFHVIPPFKFYINKDTSIAYETSPLLLEVQSLKVDTSEASVKDIKLPLLEKYDWREDIPFYSTIAGLLVLAILLFFLIRRWLKKKPSAAEVVKPKLSEPLDVYVLRVLNQEKEQKIYMQGKVKAYYSTVSDVIRFYIEEYFKIPALELTTEETIQIIQRNQGFISQDDFSRLKHILRNADLVKFAKVEPLMAEHENFIESAISFVQSTYKPKPVAPSEPTSVSSASTTS
jgi:hypothetical protein